MHSPYYNICKKSCLGSEKSTGAEQDRPENMWRKIQNWKQSSPISLFFFRPYIKNGDTTPLEPNHKGHSFYMSNLEPGKAWTIERKQQIGREHWQHCWIRWQLLSDAFSSTPGAVAEGNAPKVWQHTGLAWYHLQDNKIWSHIVFSMCTYQCVLLGCCRGFHSVRDSVPNPRSTGCTEFMEPWMEPNFLHEWLLRGRVTCHWVSFSCC